MNYLMSRYAVITGLALMLPLQTSAADPDCEKVLRYGRLKSTTSRNYTRMDIFYSAFCSKTISSESEAKQRADDIGFGYEGFKLSYGGKSRSTQTSEYFQAVCSAVKAGTFVQDDQMTVIETFSTAVAQAYEACVTRTGLRLWSETDPDRRELAFFYLRFNPDGQRASPKVQSIAWLPKTAFSVCQGPIVGDKLQPNSVQAFQCSVAPGFTGRDVSLSLRTDIYGAKAINAVLAEIPPPQKHDPPPKPPEPVQSPVVDTKLFPSFLLYKDSRVVDGALLGQWLTISQEDPRRGPVPEFGLMISDKQAAFEPEDRLSMTWTVDVSRHQRPSGIVSSIPTTEDIRIDRGDLLRIARFTGYSDFYRGNDPDKTNTVSLSIDASKLKSIGVQGRMTNRCATSTVTALPGESPKTLAVRNTWGLGQCDLQIRLCSTKANKLFREVDSCG